MNEKKKRTGSVLHSDTPSRRHALRLHFSMRTLAPLPSPLTFITQR